MDKQWVKNLAESRLENGQWVPPNPAAPRDYGRNQVQKAVSEIFQDVRDAAQVFNDHSRKEKKMSVFPVYAKDQEQMNGFVLVIGRLQLQLAQNQLRLEASVTRLQGFHQRTDRLHELEAHCDPFGGISWIMDRKSIMTKEMIVKQLLHDICHEAYLSEW